MENISLIEKFKVLFDLIKSTSEMKIVIPIILFIAVTLILGIFKKRNIFVYIGSYLIIIGSLIGLYHSEFLCMLDYLVQFTTDSILFPSLGIYVVMLLLSNIIVITSILNKKISLLIKNINIVFFSLIELVTFFIIKLIVNSDVDIYNTLTIYSNDKLLVLIELSMALFAIWIILLNVINIINKLINKVNNKEIVNTDIVFNTNDEEKVVIKEVIKEVPVEVIKEVMVPVEPEPETIFNISSNEIKVSYLNNRLELIEEKEEIKEPEFVEFVPIKKKRLEIDY